MAKRNYTKEQALEAAGLPNTPEGLKRFYELYPDEAAFQMACGGALPRRMNYGGILKYAPGGEEVNPWIAKGYTATDPNAPVPSSYFRPGEDANTPNVQTFNPRDINAIDPLYTAPAPSSGYQISDPRIQQKVATNKGFNTFADYVASDQDPTLTRKFPEYASTASIPNQAMGGAPEAFPYIQTEKEFFSPRFYNTYNPNNGSSLKMGGGFGEGHPFSTQPTFAQFRSYGTPTRGPQYIAQEGGANIPFIAGELPMYDYGSDYDYAYGGIPEYQGAGQFPRIPKPSGKYANLVGMPNSMRAQEQANRQQADIRQAEDIELLKTVLHPQNYGPGGKGAFFGAIGKTGKFDNQIAHMMAKSIKPGAGKNFMSPEDGKYIKYISDKLQPNAPGIMGRGVDYTKNLFKGLKGHDWRPGAIGLGLGTAGVAGYYGLSDSEDALMRAPRPVPYRNQDIAPAPTSTPKAIPHWNKNPNGSYTQRK